MKAITSTTTTETELTPQILAQAFWDLDDTEQADFFEALADAVTQSQQEDPKAPLYNYGEMQWCWMHSELQERRRKGNSKGLNMYLALSVFAFELFQGCGLKQSPAPQEL